MPPRTLLITQKTWQTFCEIFPNAAQWLALELNMPLYQLPSLTPDGSPAPVAVLEGEPKSDDHSH